MKRHPFGDLVEQHLSRGYGLGKGKLAVGIDQDRAVITGMCQGQRLSGPLARERVLKIIAWFHEQGVLQTRVEANALLEAAGMSRLGTIEAATGENLLSQKLGESEPAPSSGQSQDRVSPVFGSLPPLPPYFIGRDEDVLNLKQQFRIGPTLAGSAQALTAVRGWPGVGKTTLAAALAHDPEILRAFPDGVLWASLGQQPSIFGELAAWGRVLGIPMVDVRSIEDVVARLRSGLHTKRMLLIVDDVWQKEHAAAFRVGGPGCALLFTTRLPEVAEEIVPSQAVYILGVLSEDAALELLHMLAPQVVAEHPAASRELVQDLEGLPLAIQVAGHLLNAEYKYGFSVVELLAEIRAGAKLIAAQAPIDRTDLANQTTPTVAALLKKSTDLLDPKALDCFAYLGAFAPKPATFDGAAMKSVWQVADPRLMIRTLVSRGLLEPSTDQRFWMHALLVMHARSLLTE